MTAEFDKFVASLADLDEELDASVERIALIKRRARHIREAHDRGEHLLDVLPRREDREQTIVRTLRELQDGLSEYGVRVRRAEAVALKAEGLSVEKIAELFGVSRQRVSRLLRGAGW